MGMSCGNSNSLRGCCVKKFVQDSSSSSLVLWQLLVILYRNFFQARYHLTVICFMMCLNFKVTKIWSCMSLVLG